MTSTNIATLPLPILADQAVNAARSWFETTTRGNRGPKVEAARRSLEDAERELSRGRHQLAFAHAVHVLAYAVGKRHATYKAYQGAYAQLFNA